VYIKAASKLAEIIVDATPEDTGALKGAWTPNIGSPVFRSEGNERLDIGGEQTKSEIREVFSQWQTNEGDLFLTNGMSYADTIENGRKGYGVGSKQAPEGMVAVNIRRWPLIVTEFSREIA
jgi:hypothetical protein